ncbi:MAG: hypothetical protein IT210_25680 [Armatimonadetes bacterium]|nr:hypothetical protein [Armatimonadota bacterium]
MNRQAEQEAARLTAVEPTVFLIGPEDALRQAVDLAVSNPGPASRAELAVRWQSGEAAVPLGDIPAGESRQRVYIPDIRNSPEVKFALHTGRRVADVFRVPWRPVRHWELFLVHTSHHDLGYTDLPGHVLREYDGFLDDVVRFCGETADWPEESRFRYGVEQGWSVLHYLENRPPEAAERLVRLIREGRIEVTALLGNETSELCGHEEQIRLVYPAFRLKRRYGIPIRTAELNDVPGLSWGLASVLSGAGVRYFAPGLPDYFSWGFTVRPFWDEEAVLPRGASGAFWWEGPDGSRVLFWYGHGADLWNEAQAEQDLPRRLRGLEDNGYPFDLARFTFWGGGRDNSPPDIRLSLIARGWNRRWAYPRLRVATDSQFFESLEKRYGGGLRVLRGDMPNTDYTIGASSTAKETGINRLAYDTLTSAEKFAASAGLVSDYEYPAQALEEGYDSALLYDEHTWGMAHPIGPAQDGCWSEKSQFAYRAAALAQDVLTKSANRIADSVRLGEEGYHLLVFNPLSFTRTDVMSVPAVTPSPCGRPMHWSHPPEGGGPARMVCGTAVGRSLVDLPLSLLEKPFALIDLSTGQSVPYQIAVLDSPAAARPMAAYRWALGAVDPAHLKEIVFVAENVPPVGYKAYRIAPAEQVPAFESRLQAGDSSLENRYYRIALDPETGAILSLFDKELQREWVDGRAAHGFNQLVARFSQTGEVQAAGRSEIRRGECGPVRASVTIRGSGPGCPQRVQEVILYDAIKRIDIANRLLKDSTPLIEHYFAFPFAVESPSFRYEASNAVIEPIRDQLPGTNSDAFPVQHWVSAWDEAGGVSWSSLESPVAMLGGFRPCPVSQAHHGATPPDFGQAFLTGPAQLEKGHIYSCALISNFRTNFQPVQCGDVLFRYSLTSHRQDWREGGSVRFGWSASTPLFPACVTGPQEGNLPEAAGFVHIDCGHALLLTFKRAEDGDGLILRLAETGGQDASAAVTLPYFRIDQAFRTNLVEENEATLHYTLHTVHVPLRAGGISTVRCRGMAVV